MSWVSCQYLATKLNSEAFFRSPSLHAENSSIIGPIIGGVLAEPCKTLPSLFPAGTIWEKFPYLLPNLFSALAVFCGVIIGLLFLEETHEEKRHNRDRGLEFGKYLLSMLPWNHEKRVQLPIAKGDCQPLLVDTPELLPGYQSTENSPKLKSMSSRGLPEALDMPLPRVRGPSHNKVFTRTVMLNIISYGILALYEHTTSYLLM